METDFSFQPTTRRTCTMRPKTLVHLLTLTLLTGTVLFNASEALSKVRPIGPSSLRAVPQLPTQMPSMPPPPITPPPPPPSPTVFPTPIDLNPTRGTRDDASTATPTPTPRPSETPVYSPTPLATATASTPTPSPTPDASEPAPGSGSWWPWIAGVLFLILIIMGISGRRDRRN